jgi:hypothetical protein
MLTNVVIEDKSIEEGMACTGLKTKRELFDRIASVSSLQMFPV